MSVEFATPLAALAGLVGLVPIAIAVVRSRQASGLRRVLGLPDPTAPTRFGRPLALGCAFALLGLAAAQPSLARQRERLVRTDAQLLVVLDNSRSMLASAGPRGLPRYRRAATFARELRTALPELPAGVAPSTTASCRISSRRWTNRPTARSSPMRTGSRSRRRRSTPILSRRRSASWTRS